MRNAKTKSKKIPKTKKSGLGEDLRKIREKAIKSGELVLIKDKKEMEKFVNDRRFG